MILDYLEKVAVPIVLAMITALGVGGIRIFRAGDAEATPASPTTPVNVPPPAPEPENDDEVQAWLYGEVRRLLLSEAASTLKATEQDTRAAAQEFRLTQMEEKLTRVTEDYMVLREGAIPLVEWLDAGAHHPHPTVSATVRRLLGIPTPASVPKWD